MDISSNNDNNIIVNIDHKDTINEDIDDSNNIHHRRRRHQQLPPPLPPQSGRKLKKVSSLKLPRSFDSAASTSTSSVAADHRVKRYTSLRDLTVDVDAAEGILVNGNGYAMKNRLLYRAASAYLQCSPVTTGGSGGINYYRNRLASFRRRMNRNTSVLCLCWRAYVSDPIMACFRPIITFFFATRW